MLLNMSMSADAIWANLLPAVLGVMQPPRERVQDAYTKKNSAPLVPISLLFELLELNDNFVNEVLDILLHD